MIEKGKKRNAKKSKNMPMWAKLRIAYEYASPEEQAQFEKLSKSILKNKKKSLPTDCAPSGCKTAGPHTGGCHTGSSCLSSALQGCR